MKSHYLLFIFALVVVLVCYYVKAGSRTAVRMNASTIIDMPENGGFLFLDDGKHK
jgi:hypothetical protein